MKFLTLAFVINFIIVMWKGTQWKFGFRFCAARFRTNESKFLQCNKKQTQMGLYLLRLTCLDVK